MRRVALEDGSIAEINTETELDVTIARRMRRVRLQRGEAWFTVAKDRTRPFVVEASDIRVAAIGAAFSVYDVGAHIDVLVTEGVVEAWRRMNKATRVRIAAGSRLRIGRDGAFIVAESVEGIARDLAWRTGQIDLAGRSLAEAVAQFNRYNRRSIYIDDPALGRQTLIGLSEPTSLRALLGPSLSPSVHRCRKQRRRSAWVRRRPEIKPTNSCLPINQTKFSANSEQATQVDGRKSPICRTFQGMDHVSAPERRGG